MLYNKKSNQIDRISGFLVINLLQPIRIDIPLISPVSTLFSHEIEYTIFSRVEHHNDFEATVYSHTQGWQ